MYHVEKGVSAFFLMNETVNRVLRTCTRIDKEASVLNYTVSNSITLVRLRSKGGEDATSQLAKRLLLELPFSRTAVTTNLLDGSLETAIEVASPEHERLSARIYASAGQLPRILSTLAVFSVVTGAVFFVVGLALVARRHLS